VQHFDAEVREKKVEDVPKDREDKDQLNMRRSTQREWKVNIDLGLN